MRSRRTTGAVFTAACRLPHKPGAIYFATAAIAVVSAVIGVWVPLIVGPINPPSESLTVGAQTSYGKLLYEKNCVSCRGAEGREEPGWTYRERSAPALGSSRHAWHHDDAQPVGMILDKPAPDSVQPAWRGVLSREEALEVVAYIKTLWTVFVRENCQGANRTKCMSHQ